MAKISDEAREIYDKKIQPYLNEITASSEKEKSILALAEKDTAGIG